MIQKPITNSTNSENSENSDSEINKNSENSESETDFFFNTVTYTASFNSSPSANLVKVI